jgi:hypothetical protein
MTKSSNCVFFFLLLLRGREGLVLQDRRSFALSQASGLVLSTTAPSDQQQQEEELTTTTSTSTLSPQQLASLFSAQKVRWVDEVGDGAVIPWSQMRYSTSTLNRQGRVVPAAAPPTRFPTWLLFAGSWRITYKFRGASFPMGRELLTLRVPGAGIATCLSLPNVGLNPPPFSVRFTALGGAGASEAAATNGAAEDWPYNAPRKLEAFWPASKTLYVQNPDATAAGGTLRKEQQQLLPSSSSSSLRCFVSGEGCLASENPTLHAPSSRLAMGYEAPTRARGSSPLVGQTLEMTVVAGRSYEVLANEGTGGGGGKGAAGGVYSFGAERSFVQNNPEQELQTFFREFLTLAPSFDEGTTGGTGSTGADSGAASPVVRRAKGRLRVAAFLPHGEPNPAPNGASLQVPNEPIENQRAGPGPRLPLRETYDDSLAVALYDYDLELVAEGPDGEEQQLHVA